MSHRRMPGKLARHLRRSEHQQRDNLVVLTGLPRDTLKWTMRRLHGDTSRRPARYVGAPSTRSRSRNLYSKASIAETLTLIERECQRYTPHRIMVLYVPSADSANLVEALGFVCFLAPLCPGTSDDGALAAHWRHTVSEVTSVVYETLSRALKTTNALKAEITDRRISPFTLPARNFYYPHSRSTIGLAYQAFIANGFDTQHLKSKLEPSRFTRGQLPQGAFKGQQYADSFFQDLRERVFPPDLHHARSRPLKEVTGPTLSLELQQRFRFGVMVRDGNLHYDMQYELPRRLADEPMYCAMEGEVSVTASHANVGVNDVVWVPSGRKDRRKK